MSGNTFIALRSVDIATTDKNPKIRLTNLDPEYTYLAVAGPDQEWYEKLLETTNEISILYKSKKAINRTPEHGETPRNTLYIFEVADNFIEELSKLKAEIEAKRAPALIRFKECCRAFENNSLAGYGWFTDKTCKTYIPEYSDYNRLVAQYYFSYHRDYRYADDYKGL